MGGIVISCCSDRASVQGTRQWAAGDDLGDQNSSS
jgi:hypothetical protein